MKVFIQNYGCEMNTAESLYIAQELEQRGVTICSSDNDADVIVVNICSVRKSAENRVFGTLGHYKYIKASRRLCLILTGCMAENEKKLLEKDYPYIDFIIPNNLKKQIIVCLRKLFS